MSGETIKLECKKCDWKTKPRQIILCDNVKCGPYYCPDCGEIMKVTKGQLEKPNNLIHLNREIVMKCPECNHSLFHILANKPEITAITGFICDYCGESIRIEILKSDT